jgi:hypothetical protein
VLVSPSHTSLLLLSPDADYLEDVLPRLWFAGADRHATDQDARKSVDYCLDVD